MLRKLRKPHFNNNTQRHHRNSEEGEEHFRKISQKKI